MQITTQKLLVTSLLCVLAACSDDDDVSSSNVPADGAAITTEPAFEALTFTLPLAMRQAPADSNNWYVAEKAGRVRAFTNADDATETRLFIDITDRVDSGAFEAGLLGIAFHPEYQTNRQVFLSYTGNDEGLVSYISRFTSLDDGMTLDPDSEEILLTLTQPFNNHNGGNILFGPDGYLYIGFGDGGSGNDPNGLTQDFLNLFGTILRIDVDAGAPYAIPDDNPFAGNDLCNTGFGAAECPEIYATGLRNPWRWSFDRQTGELWLADVGQRMFEEVDIVDLGGNYGWPFYEGTRCNTEAPVVDCDFPGLLPLTEYGRTEGQSVTGGYVYRGTEIPQLVGVYVYGDFLSGNLFQYFATGNRIVESITPSDLVISSFGEGHDGELYITEYITGKLHKIIAN